MFLLFFFNTGPLLITVSFILKRFILYKHVYYYIIIFIIIIYYYYYYYYYIIIIARIMRYKPYVIMKISTMISDFRMGI